MLTLGVALHLSYKQIVKRLIYFNDHFVLKIGACHKKRKKKQNKTKNKKKLVLYANYSKTCLVL